MSHARNHKTIVGIPWSLLMAEFAGTALLVGVGLSIVILDTGVGSPIVRLLPDAGLRRVVTGFLFGATGGLIAFSSIGKVSGAHINPVVTMAFWMRGKMSNAHATGYVIAQLAGAIVGALPLLLWGATGSSVHFGATLPGRGYDAAQALTGEALTTFALIVGLLFFVGHPRTRQFTPLLFPFLYAVMVYLEAPISGTSTNPARTLGPAVISGAWRDWWVYLAGPTIGTVSAVAAFRSRWLGRFETDVAKLYHFDYDPYGLFHARPAVREALR